MTTSGSSGRKGLFVYDDAGLGHDRRAVPALQRDRRHAPARPAPALGRHRRRLAGAHEPPRRADARRRAAPRALAARHAAARASSSRRSTASSRTSSTPIRRWPCCWPRSRPPGRLRLSLRAMSTSSELRTPETTARDRGGVRRDAVRPLRDDRGPVGIGVRAPRRPAPLRGRRDRRERRRRRAPGTRRCAGRPAAGHQPRQPRAAAHPPRGAPTR